MKNVALIAVILGLIGSAANAESAVSEAPTMTLAMNTAIESKFVDSMSAINIQSDVAAKQIELNVNKTMEEVSLALDKQIEAKMAKELEYAIQ